MDAINPCMYCENDSRLTDIMIQICELDTSVVYLCKGQTDKGRCIDAYKNAHKHELFELTEADRGRFINDVAKVASAVKKAFSPQKINYGAYGDKMTHVHCHFVPRYENTSHWGDTFDMMPEDKMLLSEPEYQGIIREYNDFCNI